MKDESAAVRASAFTSSFRLHPSSFSAEADEFVEDAVCGVEFGHERERGGPFAVAREQRDDVGLRVEARAVLSEVVGDDGVEILAQEFVARVLDNVVGLRGEADDEQAV